MPVRLTDLEEPLEAGLAEVEAEVLLGLYVPLGLDGALTAEEPLGVPAEEPETEPWRETLLPAWRLAWLLETEDE